MYPFVDPSWGTRRKIHLAENFVYQRAVIRVGFRFKKEGFFLTRQHRLLLGQGELKRTGGGGEGARGGGGEEMRGEERGVTKFSRPVENRDV